MQLSAKEIKEMIQNLEIVIEDLLDQKAELEDQLEQANKQEAKNAKSDQS